MLCETRCMTGMVLDEANSQEAPDPESWILCPAAQLDFYKATHFGIRRDGHCDVIACLVSERGRHSVCPDELPVIS